LIALSAPYFLFTFMIVSNYQNQSRNDSGVEGKMQLSSDN
jgi:hypothetical protein